MHSEWGLERVRSPEWKGNGNPGIQRFVDLHAELYRIGWERVQINRGAGFGAVYLDLQCLHAERSDNFDE
jgi:hypothetical protein